MMQVKYIDLTVHCIPVRERRLKAESIDSTPQPALKGYAIVQEKYYGIT
jgi:hypothetical protein